MIAKGNDICPKCGGRLVYYDSCYRKVLEKRREVKRYLLHRYHCPTCGSYHRELPNDILPYKQYCADIVQGVLDGIISNDILGFEDYPCEQTIKNWTSRNLQLFIWNKINFN